MGYIMSATHLWARVCLVFTDCVHVKQYVAIERCVLYYVIIFLGVLCAHCYVNVNQCSSHLCSLQDRVDTFE